MAGSTEVRVRLRITGRVQGVCYRAAAREQAQGLGVSGWVRNCSDGSVEAMAAGTRENIDRFIAWCEQGPRAAQVAGVEVQRVDEAPPAGAFEIRF